MLNDTILFTERRVKATTRDMLVDKSEFDTYGFFFFFKARIFTRKEKL